MPDAVVAFTGIVIFAQMFVLGIQHRAEDLSRLLADAGLLTRSFLSVLVLVPVAALVLIALLQPPTEVALGIALLAAAPGAPLTLRRSESAGADRSHVATLQLLLALSAIAFTPLALAVFDAVHDVSPPSVAPSDVAYQVATVTFLPALLGWSLARLAPGPVAANRGRILLVAKALFVAFLLAVVLALLFAAQLRANLMLGWAGVTAVVLLAIFALMGGHVLAGGPAWRRSGLAIASVARNLGLALFVAEASPDYAVAIPTILTYALAGTVLALPYSRWMAGRSGTVDSDA